MTLIGNTAADYPSRLTQYVWTIHREYPGGSEFPDEHQASGIRKAERVRSALKEI
jgi:hypothetical protein